MVQKTNYSKEDVEAFIKRVDAFGETPVGTLLIILAAGLVGGWLFY